MLLGVDDNRLMLPLLEVLDSRTWRSIWKVLLAFPIPFLLIVTELMGRKEGSENRAST